MATPALRFSHRLPYATPGGRLHPEEEAILPYELTYNADPEYLAKHRDWYAQAEKDLNSQILRDPHKALSSLQRRYRDAEARFTDPAFVSGIKYYTKHIKKLTQDAPALKAYREGKLQTPEELSQYLRNAYKERKVTAPAIAFNPFDVAKTVGKVIAGMGASAAGSTAAAINSVALGSLRDYDRDKAEIVEKVQASPVGPLLTHVPETLGGQALEHGLNLVGKGVEWATDKVAPYLGYLGGGGSEAERIKRGKAITDMGMTALMAYSPLKGAARIGGKAAGGTLAKAGEILKAPEIAKAGEKIREFVSPKTTALKLDPAAEEAFAARIKGHPDLESLVTHQPERLPAITELSPKKLMEPFSELGDTFRLERLSNRGFVSEGDRLGKQLVYEMRKDLSPTELVDLGKAIEDPQLLASASQPIRSWHKKITDLNDMIGEEMVRLKQLEPGQFAARAGGKAQQRVLIDEAMAKSLDDLTQQEKLSPYEEFAKNVKQREHEGGSRLLSHDLDPLELDRVETALKTGKTEGLTDKELAVYADVDPYVNARKHIPRPDIADTPSTYLHRTYKVQALGKDWLEDLTAKNREPNPLDRSLAMQRANLSLDQRTSLGQVTDAAMATEEHLRKAIPAIGTGRFLDAINKNMPGLIWRDSPYPLHVADAGIEHIKISEIPKALSAQRKLVKAEPQNKLAKNRLDALEVAVKQVELPPKNFVLLDDSAGYGPLKNTYVHKALHNDLVDAGFPLQDAPWAWLRGASRLAEKYIGTYKVTKTALNLPTMLRNIPEGIVRLDMSGVPIDEAATYWLKAAKHVLSKDDWARELSATGLTKGSFMSEELKPALDAIMKESRDSKGFLRKVLGKGIDLGGAGVEKMLEAYNFPDKVTYLAKYMWELDHGATKAQAALEASKWGFDYSEIPSALKVGRKSLLPFATYGYKVTPRVAEMMAKRPGRMLKYQLLPYLASEEIAKQNQTFTPEERDAIAHMAANHVIEHGQPTYLPYRSPKNNIEFTDFGRLMPWGGLAEGGSQIAQGLYEHILGLPADSTGKIMEGASKTVGLAVPMEKSVGALGSITSGKPLVDSFTGEALNNPLDSAWVNTLKTLNHFVVEDIVPPFITQGIKKINKIMNPKADKDIGWRELIAGTLGVTHHQLDPARQRMATDTMVRMLDRTWSRYEAEHDPTEEDYMSKYESYLAAKQRILQRGTLEAERRGIDPRRAATYQRDVQRLKDLSGVSDAGNQALVDTATLSAAFKKDRGRKHRDRKFWETAK